MGLLPAWQGKHFVFVAVDIHSGLLFAYSTMHYNQHSMLILLTELTTQYQELKQIQSSQGIHITSTIVQDCVRVL